MKLDGLFRIEDIFDDQSVVKKICENGRDSSKPENHSPMFFDLIIYDDNNNEIYSSLKENNRVSECFPPEMDPNDQRDFEYLIKYKCLAFYLDEYKFSRVLRHCLKSMKRGEYSTLRCKNLQLIKYGLDFDVLSKINQKPKELLYKIKLYHFRDVNIIFSFSLPKNI